MMLSRVAERLYWAARYLERAEDTARIINVNSNLLLDLPGETRFGWAPLVQIIGVEDELVEQEWSESQVLQVLLGATKHPCSILASLHAARENLRTTRDVVPREAWEKLNNLYRYTEQHGQQGIDRQSRYNFFNRLIERCQLITGVLVATMTHDEAYEFTRIGRNLERADMTSRILDVRSANLLPSHGGTLGPFQSIQWMSVLKSLTAYQMYRREAHTGVNGTSVLRFLLQNPHFPRSIFHCIAELQQSLGILPRSDTARRMVLRLKRSLATAKVENITHEELHQFMERLQLTLEQLHGKIQETYFINNAPTPESDSLAA